MGPYLQRSAHPYENQPDVYISQLNPISKAIFGLAGVTFKVRAHNGVSEAEVTLALLAFEGTEQIRPDAIISFGSVAAHFGFRGQGRR